jgi:hypothetical protein
MHAGEADPEELEDVLRTALRDATVRVGYLHPGGAEVTDVSGSAIGTAGLEDALVGEACCVALCRGCRPQLARWRSGACGVGEPVPTLTEAAVSSGDSSIEGCGAIGAAGPNPVRIPVATRPPAIPGRPSAGLRPRR